MTSAERELMLATAAGVARLLERSAEEGVRIEDGEETLRSAERIADAMAKVKEACERENESAKQRQSYQQEQHTARCVAGECKPCVATLMPDAVLCDKCPHA